MRLLKRAEVFTSKGEKVGMVKRVVIDAKTKDVTDLVVERGIFDAEKVVPIGLVNIENDDRILLRETNQNIEEFLNYETKHYIPSDRITEQPSENIEEYYWYPPIGFQLPTQGILPGGSVMPDYIVRTETSVPGGRVAISEGARVISADEKHIGNIEQVIVDSENNNVSHFVVGKGFFLKEHKLVPAFWVTNVEDDKIYLSVQAGMFERLPDYPSDQP